MSEQLPSTEPLVEIAPVSVIIPCYNCADTIGRAVASVMGQSCKPFQLILIDDASTDDGRTLAKLRELQIQARTMIRSVEILSMAVNGGPANARNAGWEKASQNYIAFLDADDAWHPDKLKLQYGWMDGHPEVVITGHSSFVMSPSMCFPEVEHKIRAALITPRKLLLKNLLPTRTVMMRRDIPFRFKPDMRRSEDYQLWMHIVLDGLPAWRLELPLACAFKSDFGVGGLSGALWKMEKAELETYHQFYRAGKYSLVVLWGLYAWSLIRYLRRVAVRLCHWVVPA